MVQPSDEIKARLDIVDIIRQYVPLKAAGTSFLGRCPFHNEKTPSFTISPVKQVWHCFGCNKGGDLFSFIMEIEKLTFPEALRLLAPKAGVVLKEHSGPEASKRNRLLDVLENAALYYHRVLMTKPEGQPARDYLKIRQLSSETATNWQIGYAPDSWEDVIVYLKTKNFSDQEIMAAGLSVRKPETGRYYNRFRGRVMFPLREMNGNVVGFTGRILPQFEQGGFNQGKYVNSPQTDLYDKSKLLFGLDKAKQAIREKDEVIIMEGQMDVISAHEFGFTNTVASSGTAMTADQIRTLTKLTSNFLFALDSDEAGVNATLKRAEELFDNFYRFTTVGVDKWGRTKDFIDPSTSYKTTVKVITIDPLEGYKDPDEFMRKDIDGWKAAIANAVPIMQFLLDTYTAGLDLDVVANKNKTALYFLPFIKRLGSPIEREFWIKRLSATIDTGAEELHEILGTLAAPAASDVPSDSLPAATPKKQSREEILSEQLMALLLRFPSFMTGVPNRLPIEQLVGEENQAIYRFLVIYYNKNIAAAASNAGGTDASLDYTALRGWLIEYSQTPEDDVRALDRLALLAEKNFFDTTFEQAQALIATSIKELRKYYLTRRLKVVTRLIAELESQTARASSDETRLTELLREFTSLAEEIRQLAA